MENNLLKISTEASNYLFFQTMQDPGICKHLLETLLGLDADSIVYPGYLDPPDYAPHTVRANLLRDGKVICAAEIYLYYNSGPDINQILHRHEDAMAWELLLAGGIGSIKDIYTVCIMREDPCGWGQALYRMGQRPVGKIVTVPDCARTYILNTAYTTPNAHPDVLAYLDLMRGVERSDNAFAVRVRGRIEAIKHDPQTPEEYARWWEVWQHEQSQK